MPVKETVNTQREKNNYEPLLVAFCCNWCSYAGADLAGTSRMNYPENIKIIRVPCSCRINPGFVLRAFQKGADGVLIAGCHPGDCHYMTGNYHTRRRFTVFKELLNYMGIEEARFKVDWISASEGRKFADTATDFTNKLKELGPDRKLRDSRWKQ
ncbi:MAG: hydrogenase iron-sulfur subunit [Bacillota bacterium]